MSLDLLRIECKLDLILHALKAQDPTLRALTQDGHTLENYGSDLCPLCEGPITLTMDVLNETFRRDCACRGPFKVVPGISTLTKPPVTSPTRVLHLQPPSEVEPDRDEPAPTYSRGTP